MSGQEEGLTRRTARGMGWAYGSYVAGRLLVLLTTALLARLLTPEEFGLVALALTFTAFLDMIQDLGLAEALIIVDEHEVEVRAQTAFLAMAGFGVVLAGITAALGPLAADFFDESELVAMMPVLGLTFIFRSLGATHYALAQKRMDFRARTVGEMADVVVRGTTGIVLAVAGAGAWSLVLGYVAGTLAMTAALWATVTWRPTLKGRREHLRQLLGFGGALTGVTVAGAVLGNVPGILIGRVLGTQELGLYSLASRLPELVIVNLSVVAGQVLFPAFASVDLAGLRRAFLTSLHLAALVAFPVAGLLIALADPLILIAFGDQWESAAPVMQVFTLYALASPITLVCGTVLKASGRAGLLLRVALVQVVIVVPAVALSVSEGILAVAVCHAVAAGLVLVIQLVIAVRLLHLDVVALLRTLATPTVAALALTAVAVTVNALDAPPVVAVAVAAVLGGAAAVAVLWFLDRATLRGVLAAVGRRRHATEVGA
jgi:PST family polysaccharide transporter